VLKVPLFFVPEATSENQESVYADFAKWCSCSAPTTGKRIYSIVFGSNGEFWTATVGETLRGVRHQVTKSRGTKVERSHPVSDPALVLAIFPGMPFMVVTDHNIVGSVGSRFENPFLAGEPKSITYFSAAE
jgi:hypothetical protein